jgi:hypothetical protein
LRVDEGDIKANRGGGGAIGAEWGVVVLETESHGLLVEDEGAADAAAEGDGPLLAGVNVPVRGDAGSGGEGPSFAEVVVYEVLPEKVVDLGFAAGVVHGGELDEEGAEDPGTRRGQHHG